MVVIAIPLSVRFSFSMEMVTTHVYSPPWDVRRRGNSSLLFSETCESLEPSHCTVKRPTRLGVTL